MRADGIAYSKLGAIMTSVGISNHSLFECHALCERGFSQHSIQTLHRGMPHKGGTFGAQGPLDHEMR